MAVIENRIKALHYNDSLTCKRLLLEMCIDDSDRDLPNQPEKRDDIDRIA